MTAQELTQTKLFQQVVETSGISRIFAASSVRRACVKAGVLPDTLTPQDLKRVLVHLEDALRTYLPPDQVPAKMAALLALAR